ncbi:DUF5691 domain-containing protein [Actinokineospora auranticolor]|uniref:Uncharacterized protein n=1 Tax=Actinokineospora auranticolor TaxID=155976 RepID=A0A2S6GC45_9PSEU|nr:DUF5691 domain-containing protein [Actinokineospora auranticolor]PPK62049.1 hypothetical protein CLV40_13719 [Actinokineospora auranticolor]
MNAWNDLVGAALLGAQRREFDPAALPPAVAALAGQRAEPADRLLTAAAALTTYERAGRLPLSDTASAPVAAADPRPVVPAAARERLARLLAEHQPEVLEEWLRAVARAGLRVPPERVPALADAAGGRIALRAPLVEAAGPVAGWLGARNPDWAFLASPVAGDDADVWQYGSLVQRKVWFAQALVDAPDVAREALAGTWGSEPAEVRSALLELVGEHLRPSDEEFLERALDDRAQSVRHRSAELLSGMPGSALGLRMAARLRPLVSARRGTLVVTLPDEPDKAMKRDGIDAQTGAERRTTMLRRLVASTPLGFWADLGTPDDLLSWQVDGCAPSVLHESLTTAAIRQRDQEWVRTLLLRFPAEFSTAALLGALAPDALADAMTTLIKQTATANIARLVHDLPGPWSPALGTALLDWISGQLDKRFVAHAAAVVARSVPAACLTHPVVSARPADDAAPWRHTLTETLAFRRDMHAELR